MTFFETDLKNQVRVATENGLLSLLQSGARHAGLPSAFVVAIASRETNIENVAGDGGHGRGVMQIDDRSHRELCRLDFKLHPEIFIEAGCQQLAANWRWAQHHWPAYSPAQHLKIAAAGYNCGLGNELKAIVAGDADARTAHHNYGADVMARMHVLESLLLPSTTP